VGQRSQIFDGGEDFSVGRSIFAKERLPMLFNGQTSQNFCEVCPLKSIGSLFCGVRSKRDHSIVNNSMTGDAAFCQKCLITCYTYLLSCDVSY